MTNDKHMKIFREKAQEIEMILHRKGTDSFKDDPKGFLKKFDIEITNRQLEHIQRQLKIEEEKRTVLTTSAIISMIIFISQD